MKILHIIVNLDFGGAQTMLYKLLSTYSRSGLNAEVISLMGSGLAGQKINSLGVKVHSLEMKRGAASLSKILSLARLINKIQPDLIQTWMYHADLLGSFAGLLAAPRVPVIWGIRHANLDPRYNAAATLKVVKLCAYLSRYMPERIISCSQQAKETHRQIGYDKNKIIVIPNGFDLTQFHPDKKAYISVRQRLGIELDAPLIGMLARFESQKDHQNFIQAASIVSQRNNRVEFLLSGNGMDERNTQLMEWIKQAGIGQKIHLTGHREDVPEILAALDIATLSSCGEAFPNVVGEAMACGVPCVVTDVGDSAMIVGETGIVVKPQNASDLANGWTELIDAGNEYRREMGNKARTRIRDTFSIETVAARYSEIYKEVLFGTLAVQWPHE